MKKVSKKFRTMIVFVFVLAICILLNTEMETKAAQKLVTCPGSACKSGKYIYYGSDLSGVGILRYDTSTGKKKKLLKGNLYDISIKENYIYVTCNQYVGTSSVEEYIYRISKNGKSKKQLAVGCQPVIVGRYIYYKEAEIETHGGERFSVMTGYVCRMKLNGSKKERVFYNEDVRNLYSDGNELYYNISGSDSVLYKLNGQSVLKSKLNIIEEQDSSIPSTKIRRYRYESDNNRLYRLDTKTGKKNLVGRFKSIYAWRVCGSYVIVKEYCEAYYDKTEKQNINTHIYCISADGKKRVKLASWYTA